MPKSAGLTSKGEKKVEEEILFRKVAATADTARRIVPVDTGFLRDSILVNRLEEAAGWSIEVKAPYASFVEYGTRKMRPQPFLRPAIRKQFKE